jgi:hypothetical protein
MKLAMAAARRGRRTAVRTVLLRTAIVGSVLAVASSCGASTPAGPAGPPASSAASSAAPTGPAAPGAAAGCDAGAWRSAPVSVTHSVPVPPLPVITAIRTAAHPECGYDRLVLDLNGPVPSYDVRYVAQVIADPSGMPITLAGRSYLLITLRPAQAHTEAGVTTIVRPSKTVDYRVLKSYAVAGDFEGVFTVALGLTGTTSIRVGELPGHLYIDVRA